MGNRQAAVDQIKNGCVNFNGFGIMDADGRKCRAGITMRALVGSDEFGWTKRAPCIARNETEVICPHQKFPTPDEAEKLAAEYAEHSDNMIKVATLCTTDSDRRGFVLGDNYMSGRVTCPACKAVFGYARSGENGHIHGACMNPECNLRFIQ